MRRSVLIMKIRVKDGKKLFYAKVILDDDYLIYNKCKYNYNMVSEFRIKNGEGKIVLGSDSVVLTVSKFDVESVRMFLESKGVKISNS